MSTRRVPKEAGFCNPSKLPKGPNGFNLCRECRNECPGARRTFCSKECVHEWKCRTDRTYQRQQVLKRDKGICADCGHDCVADEEEYRSHKWLALGSKKDPKTGHWVYATSEEVEGAKTAMATIRERNQAKSHRMTFWDMDHKIPVIEGGGGCGLENLETCCIPCHKKRTKALAKRRADERKRAAREAADPLAKFRE